jgi:hypothetical protein
LPSMPPAPSSRDTHSVMRSWQFYAGMPLQTTGTIAINYPFQLLQTKLLQPASLGGRAPSLTAVVRDTWRQGGIRAFYRGLSGGAMCSYAITPLYMIALEATHTAVPSRP